MIARWLTVLLCCVSALLAACERGGALIVVPCSGAFSSRQTDAQEERCCASNNAKTCVTYASNELVLRERIVGDKRDGPVEYYHPGGLVAVKGQYCKGSKCGRWIEFDINGVATNDYNVEFNDK